MSVRKRTWTTAKGVEKEAWVVDYVDRSEGGQRRLKTFDKKKDAAAFAAQASVVPRTATHTAADSASMTIAEAANLWIQTGEARGLERATLAAYREHVELHIKPYLGSVKLSQLSAPMVREFEDKLAAGTMPNGAEPQPRSPAMVRKVRVSLSSLISDAQERGPRGAQCRARPAVDPPTRDRAPVRPSVARKASSRLASTFQQGRKSRPLPGLRKGAGARSRRRRSLPGCAPPSCAGCAGPTSTLPVKGELHVHQRADRYSVIGKPKSESGQRSVPLTPIVANTLREWKLACPKSEQGLVFPSMGGIVEHHSNIVT